MDNPCRAAVSAKCRGRLVLPFARVALFSVLAEATVTQSRGIPWVEAMQLEAGLFGGELPPDKICRAIAATLVRGEGVRQGADARNAAAQTLAR